MNMVASDQVHLLTYSLVAVLSNTLYECGVHISLSCLILPVKDNYHVLHVCGVLSMIAFGRAGTVGQPIGLTWSICAQDWIRQTGTGMAGSLRNDVAVQMAAW